MAATVRADCLDRILILGRRQSSTCCASTAATTTSTGRTARSNLFPPNGRDPTPLNAPDRLQRRDLLGGVIHEYRAAA
jgi:hypothetical protein